MPSDLDFSGKTVLVVGGSSGIGNGVAQAFRARGANVHVWGTRPKASDYDPAEGSDMTGLHYTSVDVSNDDAVANATPAFSSLDVLVQCQGVVVYKRGEFEMPGFEKVIQLNLNSMMACALKFRDMLAERKGSMVLLSSVAAFRTTFGNPAYNASKAGILGLTRALACAWIGDGIRVNGVAPGFVATKMTKVTVENPHRMEAAINMIPARRAGKPEDIAGAVLYLSSPLADYVVGQTLAVCGGSSIQ